MKKYLISGFNTVQDVKLDAGTYTLVAYAKSMYSDIYTFALGDGVSWTEYDIDVVKGQLCKVWLTFTIDKKATKFKPIANNFTEELPVYVTGLQLTRGNIPVEAGASPFDIDQILNDVQADANVAKAKTKFMTEIDGGLIYSAMMKLYDAGGTGDEMAGISGIAGDDKSDPAFWAGGTYAQAIGGTAKAIIRHDGSSKFTDAEITGTVNAGGANSARTEINNDGIQVFNALNIMNIRFGLKNGYAVMEYYDNDGNFLYDLGPSGISEIGVREEKWVEVKLVYLGDSFSNVLTDYQIKTKYKTSDLQNETTFYRYVSKVVAGQNQDLTNDGKIFENSNKTSDYIADGVYMRKTRGDNMQHLTEGTGTRIYPSGIQPENEDVFDTSPLYFVGLMYYSGGEMVSKANAYWNG